MFAAGESGATKDESEILKKYPMMNLKETEWNFIECFGPINMHSTAKDCLREKPSK